MEKRPKKEIEERKHRLKEAINLHEIEGMTISKNQIAILEMFDREGWSDEKCLEYLSKIYKEDSSESNQTI